MFKFSPAQVVLSLIGPLYFGNYNTILILTNGRQPKYFWQMEDDQNILADGRQP